MSGSSSEFHGLLLHLWGDLQNVNVLWQVGVLALCVMVGWLLSQQHDHQYREPRRLGRQLLYGADPLGAG